MRSSLATAAALLVALGCAAPTAIAPAGGDGQARAVLDTFAAAVDGGRWDVAYALLSPRWRVPVPERGEVATLAVGEGKAARLVREGAAWRVDALE